MNKFTKARIIIPLIAPFLALITFLIRESVRSSTYTYSIPMLGVDIMSRTDEIALTLSMDMLLFFIIVELPLLIGFEIAYIVANRKSKKKEES